MTGKVPADAFEQYHRLGPDRSYARLAEILGVSKRAITNRAKVEDWQRRLEEIERKTRETSDRRLAEQVEEARERHLKTVRAIAGRALQGLQQFPLESGQQAIRAAEIAIRLERLLLGIPDRIERTEVERVGPTESGARERLRLLVENHKASIEREEELRKEAERKDKAQAELEAAKKKDAEYPPKLRILRDS